VTLGADLQQTFIAPLNRASIAYMVTGGVAAIVYGEPRLTNDIDLVLALPAGEARRLADAFPADKYYVPPVEVIAEEIGRPRGGHFNLLHLETSLRADLYPVGEEPLLAWGLERRRRIRFGGGEMPLASPEYVIIQKLAWFRDGGSDRHLRDISAMRRISGATIDPKEISLWTARLGLEHEWERALAWSERG
jgi:hypothetical protein